jgi:predicted nucleotidyltransferase
MNNTPLVHAVLMHLRRWADAVRTDLGTVGQYVFGSLIYRDGAQFGERSDVDIIVVIPREAGSAINRSTWLYRLADRKRALEADLGRILERTDADKVICSVVAVTTLEVTADIHKDGAQSFFAENRFLDLLRAEVRRGLPGAGSRAVTERLVIECVRFAQKKRNTFLGVSASGRSPEVFSTCCMSARRLSAHCITAITVFGWNRALRSATDSSSGWLTNPFTDTLWLSASISGGCRGCGYRNHPPP